MKRIPKRRSTLRKGLIVDADIVTRLSKNKPADLNGLKAEHVKVADSQLVLLSILVSSIMVYSYIPIGVSQYVIVSVVEMLTQSCRRSTFLQIKTKLSTVLLK